MHLNHAMANYQHYPPPQISTHGGTPTNVQQQSSIAAGLQQTQFTLHPLSAAVQAIQHPTHQAMLHPQHPLVHLLDISSTTSTPNPTPISPTKVEVQSEEEVQVDDPRKKKQCPICKNKFRQLTTLRNHMKIHTDERPYNCKHCDKAFRQISTLTNHVKIHTGEKPFTCNICAKDFRQQSTLINHIKTHKESSTPTSLLNYQPSNTTNSKGHRNSSKMSSQSLVHQSYHNRTPISKSLYTGSYSSPQAEQLVKPFECNVCKRRFPQLSTLQNHERTHIDPKPYKCETCDKSFRQLATLANHKKIHSGDKPYTCNFCSTQFRQQSTLTNHMKTHATAAAAAAAASGAPLPTTTAGGGGQLAIQHAGLHAQMHAQGGSNITSQHHLNPNMLHHQLQVDHPLLHFLDSNTTVSPISKEQYHISDRCSQASAASSLKCESADRPFACQTCHRAFSQQSTLTNHLKTHTGEKPYKCKICDSYFRQLSTLNNHMKIHTGEKPYNCSYCPKQFRQKSTLTNHIRVHTM